MTDRPSFIAHSFEPALSHVFNVASHFVSSVAEAAMDPAGPDGFKWFAGGMAAVLVLGMYPHIAEAARHPASSLKNLVRGTIKTAAFLGTGLVAFGTVATWTERGLEKEEFVGAFSDSVRDVGKMIGIDFSSDKQDPAPGTAYYEVPAANGQGPVRFALPAKPVSGAPVALAQNTQTAALRPVL